MNLGWFYFYQFYRAPDALTMSAKLLGSKSSAVNYWSGFYKHQSDLSNQKLLLQSLYMLCLWESVFPWTPKFQVALLLSMPTRTILGNWIFLSFVFFCIKIGDQNNVPERNIRPKIKPYMQAYHFVQ